MWTCGTRERQIWVCHCLPVQLIARASPKQRDVVSRRRNLWLTKPLFFIWKDELEGKFFFLYVPLHSVALCLKQWIST